MGGFLDRGLLHCHVGQEDLVDLDVGLGLQPLEDLRLDVLAALAAGELGGALVGHDVGDDVAHDRLLGQRPVAVGRRGAAFAAGGGRGGEALVEDQPDAELGELAIGEVDEEVLRQDVDLALDLRLLLRSRLGEDELVRAAEDDQQHEGNDDLQLALHLRFSGPKSGAKRGRSSAFAASSAALPVATRGRSTSTRRLRARPSAVVLVVRGSSAARPAASMRSGATPTSAKVRTTEAARPADSSQLDGNAAVWMGRGSVKPRTRIACWLSACRSWPTLRSSGRPSGWTVAEPLAKRSLSVSRRMTRPSLVISVVTLLSS